MDRLKSQLYCFYYYYFSAISQKKEINRNASHITTPIARMINWTSALGRIYHSVIVHNKSKKCMIYHLIVTVK